MRRSGWVLVLVLGLLGCGKSDGAPAAERVETLHHDNGKKAAEGRVRGTQRQGEWTFWDADGNVESQGSFVDSVKQGDWMQSAYDQEIEEPTRERGAYRDGKRTGLWQTRAASGWLVSEIEWDDGRMNGSYRKFHRNGKLRIEGGWRDNHEVGRWTYWYDNGQKQTEVDRDHQPPSGTSRAWYPDGGLQYEIDHATGAYTRWQLDGGVERGTDPQLVNPGAP